MTAYDGYGAIARVYDKLNAELDYSAWADFFEVCFDRYLPARPVLLLDLACGTGKMTLELARRGYDMIGVDGSVDMLMVARDRMAEEEEMPSVLYLLQDMRELELYSTVGTVVSVCDSVNYITEDEDLLEVFRLVNNYLDPMGVFVFDFNTEYKYKEILGERTIAEEREECSFIWENYYDEEEEVLEEEQTKKL